MPDIYLIYDDCKFFWVRVNSKSCLTYWLGLAMNVKSWFKEADPMQFFYFDEPFEPRKLTKPIKRSRIV